MKRQHVQQGVRAKRYTRLASLGTCAFQPLHLSVLAALWVGTLGCGRGAPPGEVAPTLAEPVPTGSASVPRSSASPGASSSTSVGVVVSSSASVAEVASALPTAKTPFFLGARAQITQILAEPKHGALKLGYLRAGAVVERDEVPSSDVGCKKGWYGIRPRGYVCANDFATVDLNDPIVKYATRRPNLDAPLPYAYGIARNGVSPFYARIPTKAETARLEMDFDTHHVWAARVAAGAKAAGDPPEYDAGVFSKDGPPDFLRDGGVVPNVSGMIRSSKALHAGHPKTKEGFGIVASFVSGPGGTTPTGGPNDRRWDLTTDYMLIPHDRMKDVRPSTFHGITLGEGQNLPAAFVRPRKHGVKVKLTEAGGIASSESLPPRTGMLLAPETKSISGQLHWATTDGFWVKAEDLVRIDPPKTFPAFATKGEKWIEVSIIHQALVAWEGTKAAYVTLVSTGRDGLGDPETGAKATIRGVYRIGNKHATVTMDSEEAGEAFSLRDVPYVQYFEAGYAIHAAYWHDGFGEPRSHGCVNLPEIDASWLFKWTGPELPASWHGVAARPMTTGTQIWIHP